MIRGDEEEGSLPRGRANRRIGRLPTSGPGKSKDQRMPSGCTTRPYLSLRSNNPAANTGSVTGQAMLKGVGIG